MPPFGKNDGPAQAGRSFGPVSAVRGAATDHRGSRDHPGRSRFWARFSLSSSPRPSGLRLSQGITELVDFGKEFPNVQGLDQIAWSRDRFECRQLFLRPFGHTPDRRV